ncbi:MAG: trigger factor [Clostridia bacterium]|nr:trigger factor [Clostridia bacterium]
MKKISLVLVVSMLAALFAMSASALKTTEVKMTVGDNVGYVNGTANEYDVAPIVVNDIVMLPVRYVAEALGATVIWDGATSTATIASATVEIKVTIGAKAAVVNGTSLDLPTPAFIENGRTYMPLGFIEEMLDADVMFDDVSKTALITLVSLSYPDGFDYAKADLTQYVKLGDYKNQTYKTEKIAEVTDEDVAKSVAETLGAFATDVEVTGRAAAIGDTVVIDFVGKLDGVAFDGGSATGQNATLGSGQYIPGFEEGIVGMNIGDAKDITVIFPEEYHASDLAGKEAVFTITLHKITEKKLPEYTDEFVQEQFKMENIAAFEAEVKKIIEEERKAEAEESMKEIIIDSVISSSEIITYPEGLIEDYVYTEVNYIKAQATGYGLSYEDLLMYAGFDKATYEAMLADEYEAMVAEELVLAAIANAEKIGATDETVDSYVQYMCMGYGVNTVEELAAQNGMSGASLINTISTFISTENAKDFILTNNSIVAE